MYGFDFDHPTQQAFMIRLMVDDKHQGKGYGRFAACFACGKISSALRCL
jgi:hypothetical protein